MADDPYKVLGVARSATDDEIRRAYHALAKTHHPDLHPGDKKAEDRFKAVTAAYEVLRDPARRARYDRGETDAGGRPRAPYGSPRGRARAKSQGGGGFADLGDLFTDLFAEMGFGRGGAKDGEADERAQVKTKGADVRYQLAVDFVEAVRGARRRVSMPDGKVLDVTIPAGIADGATLRLRGQGYAGNGGGPPGDAFVEVHVRPHESFRREGDDLHVDLAVSLAEAVLGGRVNLQTPDGEVSVAIPKGANTGTRLRLRGRGVRGADDKMGDLYVRLEVVLPEKVDPELESFVGAWAGRHPYDPRKTRRG